jgi:hypothetical protein
MGYKSPICYTLRAWCSNAAVIADATTYYMGGSAGTWSANPSFGRLYCLKPGRITGCYLWGRGTAGSNEASSFYLRLNNTTDYEISTTATLDGTSLLVQKTDMNIPFNIGDWVEFKWDTPTWVALNPANWVIQGHILVECE